MCGHGLTGRPLCGDLSGWLSSVAVPLQQALLGAGVAGDVRAVDRELRSFVMRRLSDPRHAAAVAAARARVAHRLTKVTTVDRGV